MISALLLATAASLGAAQTEVVCPRLIHGQELVGADVYLGENGELIGDRIKTKDGWQVTHRFNHGEKRRVVCLYKGGFKWAKPLDSEAIECKVLERKKGRTVTATTTCR